ncbi:MAG: Calx-beta domain-containing protein, partial [Gemmataceae bacterium]
MPAVGPLVSFQVPALSGAESVDSVSIPVILSSPSTQNVFVRCSVIAGGTATRVDDYFLVDRWIAFSPGQTRIDLPLKIRNDTLFEGDETVRIALLSPLNAQLGRNSILSYTIQSDPSDQPAAPSAPHILLTPEYLSNLRQTASTNTQQWQDFKARLDANLLVNIARETGSYQASFLTYISDYALGYQVLRDSDSETASRYADKAISMIRSGLHDYQKGSSVASQYAGRGNSQTRTFTLPNADIVPETMVVSLAPVTTIRMVHGARPFSIDTLPDSVFYSKILKVSRTPDGPADFRQGLDWRRNPNLGLGQIDWSLGGIPPAPGSVYYITVASDNDARTLPTSAWKLSGNKLTFVTAPTARQAVYVEYIHGVSSADGSTLAYQQSSAGNGGFASIGIDTTYTSRYLGRQIAIGLDWLDEYAGFPLALKSEANAMLTRWADFIRDNGYYANNPESNYGAGAYASAVMTGLALNGRTSEGTRLLNQALTWRQDNLLPMLTNQTTSLKGGFWVEGWSYGFHSAQALLIGSAALEAAGQIAAGPERHWASEVIRHLVSAQPTQDQVHNAGDWYMWPTRFIDKSLFYVLGQFADDADARSYANYILQNYKVGAFTHEEGADTSAPQPDTADAIDL